jgi:hypothetical protein
MPAKLLLRDRDRDPLAPLGASATEDFTAAAGLLARTEPVGALAALIVRLVGTLHGWDSTLRGGGSILKGVREVKLRKLASAQPLSSSRLRSSIPIVFSLHREFAVCYEREVSSPVDKPSSVAVGENQKSLWITSGLVVFCLCANSANLKLSQD